MLHIPLLRGGKPYRSVDVVQGDGFEISQANAGLIRRDLLNQWDVRESLARYSTAGLIDMCRRASDLFLNETLPVGDAAQSPAEFVEQLSTTTGLPHTLVRRNMAKNASVMAEMESVLRGLTRGVEFRVFDEGAAGGLSFFPRSATLGVVLPSNSPGVHSLWIPAFALKTLLVLKPGASEPWTPYRVIQALMAAGAPPEAFYYYPCDHAGAGEILRTCGRGMIFGDASTMRAYANDPRIELHGPGFSKILLGDDMADDWPRFVDVMASSIADNSGRSCINASGVWTPRHGAEIARAIAGRLRDIRPRQAKDPEAELAPFANPEMAVRIDAAISDGLTEPGARDVLERERLARFEGRNYLLPTILHCESPDHTLANREYLFPFAAVVECPQEEMVRRIGPTLVVTALTNDEKFRRELLTSPSVGRLNFGPVPTNKISWDQPHEGNLFDHLYARRAFQAA